MTVHDRRPICVGLGNGVGAMPADRGPLSNKVLKALRLGIVARGGGVGVLVEADDVDIKRCLPSDDFWHVHRDAPDLDGVLIFGTRDRTRPGLVRLREGAAPRSRVNAPRPILKVEVHVDEGDWELTIAGLHRPKRGGERAAAHMDDQLRHLRTDVWAMDGNLRRSAIVKRFPAYAVRSSEVMHIGGRRGKIHLGELKTRDAVKGTTDDDHPLLFVQARPAGR